MKKFKNKQNEFVTKENIGERGFFISRSVAVVASVLVEKDNETYVLIGKRGQGTPDFQGCWNMPCGYLDFEESATEAVHRELFEETGLDLEELLKNSKHHIIDLEQPWFVQHEPNGNRQNVTLRFGVYVRIDGELPELTNENCEEDEVDELLWMNVNDVDKYEWAFKHDEVLESYIGINNEKLYH